MGIKVNVRWWDGYLETFEAVEVRFGCDLLWLKLEDGNRHIPTRHVRWWSMDPESHEIKSLQEIDASSLTEKPPPVK